MKTLLTATALVLSMAAGANAADAPRAGDTLAAGPLYASGENIFYCLFINSGTINVTPTVQELFTSDSTSAIGSTSTCANNSPVVPNQSCFVFSTGAIDGALSCKLTFSAPVTNIRGALQVFDINFNSLAIVELR